MALVCILALGLPSGIYPAQQDSLLQLPTDADTVAVTPRGDYIPAPELSPSTGYLLFDRMMPGESRTLFMDLANLGEGLIQLDSLTAPAGIIQLTLPLQTLRPGQFVRFPVTYTQTDLDTHHLEIVVHWNSPRFEVSDSLALSVAATPLAPLKPEPTRISWPQSYVGMVRSERLLLQNKGRQPI